MRRRFVSFVLIIDHQPGRRIAGDTDLSVLDRAQAVGDHRKAGDPECHRPQDVAIVECHLQAFVEVFIVHVVDAIHGMHVSASEPFHCGVELGHDLVEIEELAGYRQCLGCDLFAGYFVPAAIDRVEQRFCEVDAGAEELHLLAEPHCRDAAGDAVIITPEWPHQIVVFVLQRGRVAADLDAVALEGGRHMVRPEDRDVRLGRRPQIVKCVQHPIAALGHQSASIQIHSADTFGCPIGIAAEQRIVVGRTEEPNDAELLHQLVPKLLRPRLVQNTGLEVALDVNVQEGRDAPDRHCRAVGFLDCAQIGEISPLERFLRIRSWLRYVVTIEFCHRG